MNFRSRPFFPVALTGTAAVPYSSAELPRYCKDADDCGSGWYPVGRGQLLHNGIHFESHWSRSGVFCIAPGRIVAARLGKDFNSSEHIFGSHRFVLVKHDLTLVANPEEEDYAQWTLRHPVKFYSLYMHLGLEDAQSKVPWLQTYLPFLGQPLPEGTNLLKVNQKGGLPARKAPAVSGTSIKKGEQVGMLAEGSVLRPLAGKQGMWQQVAVCTGRERVSTPDDCWVGTDADRVVPIADFSNNVRSLQSGGCVKLDYSVKGGELLGQMGVVDPGWVKDTYGVHLEVFSDEMLIPAADFGAGHWAKHEDKNEDAIFDGPGLVERMHKSAPVLDYIFKKLTNHVYARDGELSGYRAALTDADRAALRRLVTINRSFWAIDWAKAMSSKASWRGEFDWGKDEFTAAQKYMWWNECVTKHVDLPAAPAGLLHHYHPLGFIEYLGGHVPPAPLFYVKRGADECVCARAGDNLTAGEQVYVHDPSGDDFQFGLVHAAGLMRRGEPMLMEALAPSGGDPRVPRGFPDDELRIWRSISHSEGGLDAVNTWDNAFLSFGPVQQTAGTGKGVGELPGVLAHVKNADGAGRVSRAFQRHLLDHGIDVTAPTFTTDKADEGRFIIRGTTLETAAAKAPLRDFVWGYRLVKAMRDPDFATPFLEKAFQRIRTLKNITRSTGAPGQTLRLGDVFQSELVLALLLDVHINHPVLVVGRTAPLPVVKPCWIVAARAAINTNPTDGPTTPIRIAEKQTWHEMEMAKSIIEARNDSGMSDAVSRAAWIALCTSGLDNDFASALGYDDLDDAFKKTKSHNAAKRFYEQLQAAGGGFLQHPLPYAAPDE